MAKKKKLTNQERVRFGIGGGALGLIGKNIAAKGFDDAQDVVTVFTGTSRKAAKSIRKTGLQGKFGGKVFKGTNEIGDVAKRNKGLAFVTDKKRVAKEASKFAEFTARNKGGVDISDVKLKKQISFFGRKGKVISFKVPKKTLRKNFISDPENRKVLSLVRQQQGIHAKHPIAKFQRGLLHKALKNRKATGFISKRRIPGNLGLKKEIGLTGRRLFETLTKKPKTFLKGTGKIGLGVGVAAAGASLVARAITGKKKAKGKIIFRRIRGRIVPIRVKK